MKPVEAVHPFEGVLWPLLGATTLLGILLVLISFQPTSTKATAPSAACAQLQTIQHVLTPARPEILRAPAWAELERALEKVDRGLRDVLLESGPVASADSEYVMLLSATAQAAASRMVVLLERHLRTTDDDAKLSLEAAMAFEDAKARRSLHELELAAPGMKTTLVAVRDSYAQLDAARMQVQRWSREASARLPDVGNGDRCRKALEALAKTLEEEGRDGTLPVLPP